MHRVQVRSSVRGLRFHMPCGETKKKSRSEPGVGGPGRWETPGGLGPTSACRPPPSPLPGPEAPPGCSLDCPAVTRHRPGTQETWILGLAWHPFLSLALGFPICEMITEGPTELSMLNQSWENAAVRGSTLGPECQADLNATSTQLLCGLGCIRSPLWTSVSSPVK